MPPVLRLLTLVVVSAALGGCALEITPPRSHSALASAGDEPIVTDASVYALDRGPNGWRGTVRYVFTNQTAQTVSMLNCNGAYSLRLEKRVGDAWERAWSPALPECLSPPIRVQPGSSLAGEVEIFAGRLGSNTYPQFVVDEIDGVYRLVIDAAYWNYDHDGPAWGEEPPLSRRISNPFEIHAD